MIKKKIHLYATGMLLLTGTARLSAQKETHNWHFGQRNVYEFGPTSASATLTSNDQTPANSAITNAGGSATVSDQNGNLIFYTDAETIWGPSHTPVTNGTGIFGNKNTNKGVAVAKQPMSTANVLQYYVFTVGSNNKLYYSIVKKGVMPVTPATVITKNQWLITDDEMSQKMAVTNASNCSDVWVVTHNYSTSFYAYRITSSGISAPVISTIPLAKVQKFSSPTGEHNQGCMKISPDGKLLAMNYQTTNEDDQVAGYCGLFKFNNATGVVTGLETPILPCLLTFKPDNDPNTPDSTYDMHQLSHYHGVEFSPDSKVLYTTAQAHMSVGFFHYNCPGASANFGCIQVNVSTLTSAAINASRRIAAIGAGGMLQLGSDGRIYIGELLTLYGPIYGDFTRSAIEKPNVMNATLCSNECMYGTYVANSTLPTSTNHGSGLPLFNSSYFNGLTPPLLTASDNNYCPGSVSNITLSATTDPGVTIEWSSTCGGSVISTSPSFTITAPATTTTYYARVKNSCGIYSSCSPITITVLTPASLPAVFGNTDVCAGSSTMLYVIPASQQTYNWYDDQFVQIGNNVSSITVSPTVSTIYYLEVIQSGACPAKLIEIPVTVLEGPSIGTLTNEVTCTDCVVMGGTIGSPDYSYVWSPADFLSTTTAANPEFCPYQEPGIYAYTVTVTDAATGCTATFTQSVTNGSITYDAGPDGYLYDPDCPPISTDIFGVANSTSNSYFISPNWNVTNNYGDGTFEITHPDDDYPGWRTITYTITAVSPEGCSSSDQLDVYFSEPCSKMAAAPNDDELESEKFDNAFSVSPNPGNGIFTISQTVPDESRYILIVTDLTGKRVYNNVFSANTTTQIDLTSQPRGMYLLTLTNEHGAHVKKLIID